MRRTSQGVRLVINFRTSRTEASLAAIGEDRDPYKLNEHKQIESS